MRKDPFEVLGVSRHASQREIKRAYRRLVKVSHPDFGGNPTQFRQLHLAYQEVLAQLPAEKPAENNVIPFRKVDNRFNTKSSTTQVWDEERRKFPEPTFGEYFMKAVREFAVN